MGLMQGTEQASNSLVGLARQATSAVPQSEAAELWGTAFKAVAAQHLPLDGLLGSFTKALSSSVAGPVRVRSVIWKVYSIQWRPIRSARNVL